MSEAAAHLTPFLALLRHARAVAAAPGQQDSERELSPRGRAEFEALVLQLGQGGFACDLILHSPWKRAAQTAEILSRLCSSAPRAHEGLCLPPSSSTGRALLEQALRGARDARLVLVGHDPWISEIAGALGACDLGAIECGELLQFRADPLGAWNLVLRTRPG